MSSAIIIKKADGADETFQSEKLVSSLLRSGADKQSAEKVLFELEPELKSGMTTEEIYRKAFDTLKRMRREVAARYTLKRALTELGPSGYPFEKFVAKVFEAEGFKTQTGIVLEGACASHEVDMVAWNGEKTLFAEMKFHNHHSYKTDLKVALYVKARMDDLKAASAKMAGQGQSEIEEGWLITNTKFSRTAIDYAKCAGLSLLGWSYPKENNLRNLVDKAGIHPITVLTTLDKREKQELLRRNVVLCSEIKNNASLLSESGVAKGKIDDVQEEAALVCGVNV
ncbi:MAG: restriction endonuclease [bacterium]|nr:restriction endonuclease [bacterium]